MSAAFVVPMEATSTVRAEGVVGGGAESNEGHCAAGWNRLVLRLMWRKQRENGGGVEFAMKRICICEKGLKRIGLRGGAGGEGVTGEIPGSSEGLLQL